MPVGAIWAVMGDGSCIRTQATGHDFQSCRRYFLNLNGFSLCSSLLFSKTLSQKGIGQASWPAQLLPGFDQCKFGVVRNLLCHRFGPQKSPAAIFLFRIPVLSWLDMKNCPS